MTEDTGKVIPVRVALRCRPLIEREINEGCQLCLQTVKGDPQVILGKDRAFTYDYVFGPNDTQEEVYKQSASKLIDSIFKGYNGTILAYGQTGSGKTFTMGGCYEASLSEDSEQMGILPRLIRDIFEEINTRKERDFVVKVTYMEIYNEELKDLLCVSNDRDSVSIREDNNGGIMFNGLHEVTVTSHEETMKCLVRGSQSRTTAATAMNNTSSRSHAMFSLYIDQTDKDDMNDCVKIKFHLVDLAGSERCKRTKAKGDRLKEGININKGLFALGNVISALGETGDKRTHVPYRDSKLTRILQDSLGGNSHTLMIACVSPADSNIEETLNTLRYADRARNIKNKPIINRDPQAAEIRKLKTLVQDLQTQLLQNGSSLSSNRFDSTCTMSNPNLDNSAEELLKLKGSFKTLEMENFELVKQLKRSTENSTKMLNQQLKLECENERLKLRINQVKDYVGVDLELLSSSIDFENNPQARLELEKLHKITESVRSHNNEPAEEDDGDNVMEEDIEDEDDEETRTLSTPDSRAVAQKYAMRQAELHNELEEINNALNSKQALANKMNRTEEEMQAMRNQYESVVKEWQSKTDLLQKEKEELANSLKSAKANANATKVSEQRRKKLQELEQQVSQLKKKMAEQSRLVKMKETSDKQVNKLNTEIQGLKSARVKLMKQLKEESSNFMKMKKEKDNEVKKLHQKDRKREFEMHKMKKEFEKQQTVQKRKTAEAIAANQRLREAIEKQKQVLNERSLKMEKVDSTSIGNRVRKWLGHELEVKVSMRAAKYHAAELLEERRRQAEHLQWLRQQLQEGPLTDKFSWLGNNADEEEILSEEKEIKTQIKTTELNIESINSNIQEIQQKIVDADQDSKGAATWQSLHTMIEAKCALKFLLEQAVSARVDSTRTSGELQNVKDTTQEEESTIRKLKAEISRLKSKFTIEKDKLQAEHEEKMLFLLNTDNNLRGTPKATENKRVEKIKILEKKNSVLEEDNQQLKRIQKENQELKERLSALQQNSNQKKHFPPLFDDDSLESTFSIKEEREDLVKESTGKKSDKTVEKEQAHEIKANLDSDQSCTSLDNETAETKRPKRQAPRKTFVKTSSTGDISETTVDLEEDELKPKRKASRKTYVKSSDASLSESTELEDSQSTKGSRKTFVKPLDPMTESMLDTENDSTSESFTLKRKSGEDMKQTDAHKKRKRTLLPSDLKNTFFEPLEL